MEVTVWFSVNYTFWLHSNIRVHAWSQRTASQTPFLKRSHTWLQKPLIHVTEVCWVGKPLFVSKCLPSHGKTNAFGESDKQEMYLSPSTLTQRPALFLLATHKHSWQNWCLCWSYFKRIKMLYSNLFKIQLQRTRICSYKHVWILWKWQQLSNKFKVLLTKTPFIFKS